MKKISFLNKFQFSKILFLALLLVFKGISTLETGAFSFVTPQETKKLKEMKMSNVFNE